MKQVQTKLFNCIIKKKLLRLEAEAEPKNLSGRALYGGQNFASAGQDAKKYGLGLGKRVQPRPRTMASVNIAGNCSKRRPMKLNEAMVRALQHSAA